MSFTVEPDPVEPDPDDIQEEIENEEELEEEFDEEQEGVEADKDVDTGRSDIPSSIKE